MAEEVMKQIRLDDVVELLRLPHPNGDRELALRQMGEEHVVGDQARHSDDAPAGGLGEDAVDLLELGNTVGELQRVKRVDELVAREAGYLSRLAPVQLPPDLVIRLAIGVGSHVHSVIGTGTA